MVGDWTAPDGKGSTSDIVVTGKLEKRSDDDYEYQIVIHFPKRGDGIQEFSVSIIGGSGLRSTYQAPEDGYEAEVIRSQSRHPGKGTKSDSLKERNYYFRVRTLLDDAGHVKSALYGKIYGDFMDFRYYLNPTPNSRNIEFDPNKNLLRNLRSTERVEAP